MSSKTVGWRDVITEMGNRFTSGNSVPVERAMIRRVEWEAVLQKLADALPDETSDDVRALFNKGIGVLKDNRFSFSFETADEAERAFHYIADLGTLETGSAGDVSVTQESP